VHEGGYALEHSRGGGRVRFRRPDGRPIPAVPHTEAVEGDQLERRNRRHGLEIHPDTCASHWIGERLDLALAIDALAGRDVRLTERDP
jgi:hypothetical protein